MNVLQTLLLFSETKRKKNLANLSFLLSCGNARHSSQSLHSMIVLYSPCTSMPCFFAFCNSSSSVSPYIVWVQTGSPASLQFRLNVIFGTNNSLSMLKAFRSSLEGLHLLQYNCIMLGRLIDSMNENL